MTRSRLIGIKNFLIPQAPSLRWLFFFVTLIHFVGISFLPLTQDEAYYLYWSRFLSFGYFDHPPFVAWLMVPGVWWAEPWAARFLGFLLAVLSFPIALSLCRQVSMHKKEHQWAAMVLFHFSFFGLLNGVLLTPDIPLVFFWLLALHEAAAALTRPPRWLSAGFFTGLGILGKYTMVLIGPVFLIALIRKKGGLRSPWPYLGGLICLFVFMPNILWNYQNDWISYKFQYNRGLKHSHSVEGHFSDSLPSLSPKVFDERGELLAQYFTSKEKPKKKKPEKTAFEKLKRRVSDYFGGQLAIWGGFVLLAVYFLFKDGKSAFTRRKEFVFSTPEERVLLQASAWFPLLFFGFISFFQKVEANWPAPYLMGASLLLAPLFFRYQKGLKAAAICHGVIILLLFAHGFSPFNSKRPDRDRVLHETHGFSGLAKSLSRRDLPIFADTYQLTSSLSFYLPPEKRLTQWPGLTRHSEITRHKGMGTYDFSQLREKGGFYLVTTALRPPRISGFEVVSLKEYRDCISGIEVYEAKTDGSYSPRCQRPIHRWFVSHYGLKKP